MGATCGICVSVRSLVNSFRTRIQYNNAATLSLQVKNDGDNPLKSTAGASNYRIGDLLYGQQSGGTVVELTAGAGLTAINLVGNFVQFVWGNAIDSQWHHCLKTVMPL